MVAETEAAAVAATIAVVVATTGVMIVVVIAVAVIIIAVTVIQALEVVQVAIGEVIGSARSARLIILPAGLNVSSAEHQSQSEARPPLKENESDRSRSGKICTFPRGASALALAHRKN